MLCNVLEVKSASHTKQTRFPLIPSYFVKLAQLVKFDQTSDA